MKQRPKFCGKCGVGLSENNWFSSFRKGNTGICKGCANKSRQALYCTICGTPLQERRCARCATTKCCAKCGALLTDENWYRVFKKRNVRRCKACHDAVVADWAARNPEDAAKRTARWHKRNPEYSPTYYRANVDAYADRARTRLLQYKTQALNQLGGCCVVCGITDMRILQINHLNGGGQQESRFGIDMYQAIIKGMRSTDDLDVRCANHNIIYEYESGRRALPNDVVRDL